MKELTVAVYGASGFGREVMPVVRGHFQDSDVYLVFVDDGDCDEVVNGYPVVSYSDFLNKEGDKKVCIAIADAGVRRKLHENCMADAIEVITVKAGNSVIMDVVEIGSGAILSPFVTLTSNIKIGIGFHANIYSYVAHDCVVGDYVTLAPSVKCNGNVHIGDNAYIGTGAIIKQGIPGQPIVIGKGAVVGMGSVVTKSVADGDVVFGVPAKSIKRLKD